MANPNPSPATRFKAGVAANPGGKTSEQRRRELANAEMATRIRERLLAAQIARMEADPGYEPDLDANLRAFLKDSEDRGLGAPQQHVEVIDKRVSEAPLTADEWADKYAG